MKRFRQLGTILLPFALIACVVGYVAYRTRPVPTPRRRWKRFENPDALPLIASLCNALQGIYTIKNGSDFFGNTAVLKCSYTVEEAGIVYHLSLFCEKNGTYMLCEGKQQGNDILLQGHWRKAAANGAGLVQLVIRGGVSSFLNRAANNEIEIRGVFGTKSQKPRKEISLLFQHSLPDVPPFDILAHRGGSRNVDFLSVSENSVEMIRMAAQLGATGIEIDVRMTKDGVPVIFHDSFFSIHTVQNKIYGGLLHNYTLEEVRQIELRKGGRIPTLEEMLSTVLYQTPLEIVWLDIKKECDLEQIKNIQAEYHQKAAAIDRKLMIYIGIPDKYLLNCFRQLKDYREVPSLTELDLKTALEINAEVWAPQYTGGFQTANTDQIHAAGKKAYVWSLDSKFMINAYISAGGFDGLVTNVPAVVAHWYYTKGYKLRKKQVAERET
jgi:glycerophosphoryl diester phosphodiesterase